MSYKSMLAIALLSSIAASTVHAGDLIPYSNPGTQNPTWYTFTATTTGPVTAYFVGSKAAFEENIIVASNGRWLGATALSNRYLKYGDSVTFGYASAGDLITIFLSIPEKNSGVWSQKIEIAPGAFLHPNGIYSTSVSGDSRADIPAGIYVGFEDLAFQSPDSDWDYNDSAYVFTNLTVATDN